MKGERALEEREPARKGIPGLRAWLPRHGAVLAPLLRVPPPRWQAAPKDWILSAVPAYLADVVTGGRVAKTSRKETAYHGGYRIKVTTAIKDAMEAKDWAPELQGTCRPPTRCRATPGYTASSLGTRLNPKVVPD